MNNHVDVKRWAKLSFLEQMGNIGSEVGRAIAARRRGDASSEQGAIARALDLFSATASALVGQNAARLREVLRAKEQFLRLFFDDGFDDADGIEQYFMQFALAARRDV
jgi:hypothetical protein